MAVDVQKFHFRLVLLGSHGTGFLFKKFETKYKPTVEDLFAKAFDLGSVEIKVDFLDTSGSMQFPAMRRLSISTGNAFLIVYALDDESSYEVLKMCIQEIQEIRPDFQDIPIVFAGNKCDIGRERRKVPKESVSNYVHYELPRLRAKVVECSCRDNVNIDAIFRAYLSLARVSLGPAAGPAGAGAVAECAQLDRRRPNSLKATGGARKSCDGALQAAGAPAAASTAAAAAPDGPDGEPDVVNLQTAIQSKLAIQQPAKPRSKSLIWRPARKQNRTSSEPPDCRVS